MWRMNFSRCLAGGAPTFVRSTISVSYAHYHRPCPCGPHTCRHRFTNPSLSSHYCHACIRHIRSGLIGPSSPGLLANQTPTPHTLRPAEGLKGRDPVLKSKPLIASHSLPCRQEASPAFTPHSLKIPHPSFLHNTTQRSLSFIETRNIYAR